MNELLPGWPHGTSVHLFSCEQKEEKLLPFMQDDCINQ